MKNISNRFSMFGLGLVSTFRTPIKSFGVGPEVSKTPAQEEFVLYEMHETNRDKLVEASNDVIYRFLYQDCQIEQQNRH